MKTLLFGLILLSATSSFASTDTGDYIEWIPYNQIDSASTDTGDYIEWIPYNQSDKTCSDSKKSEVADLMNYTVEDIRCASTLEDFKQVVDSADVQEKEQVWKVIKTGKKEIFFLKL